MAKGDITKELGVDKIEILRDWNVQVRTATSIFEEQADGSKKIITKSFHRSVLVPFKSTRDNDKKWTHTATDLSGEDASVQAIANAAWTDSVKTAYKAFREAQTS